MQVLSLSVKAVCGIEVRHQGSWAFPDRVKVHKYCKQADACTNVQVQNVRAAYKHTQCNPKYPYSVCRCCCNEDGCNVGGLQCLEAEVPLFCPPLTAVENGVMSCTDGSNVDSQCAFRCNQGFQIDGARTLTCLSSNEWSENPPVCRPLACPELPKIANGDYDCHNGLLLGSVCRIICNEGFRLSGQKTTTCEGDSKRYSAGKWSSRGQTCERDSCDPNLVAPTHGSMSCSEDYYIGSVCAFFCDETYERVGARDSTCVEGYGYQKPSWNNEAPICKRKKCTEFPSVPTYGTLVCSDGKFVNSVCEFTCSNKYMVVGAARTTCVGTSPVWSHKEPTCEPKKCEMAFAPAHGHVSCTYDNSLDSVCTFKCDKSFHLVGNKELVCIETENGALSWNHDAPICTRKQCESRPAAPANGYLECPNNAYLGSVCNFFCEDGYYASGDLHSTCTENYNNGELSWDNKAPECIKKECAVSLRAPTNGFVQCSEMKFFGSTCQFSCDRGFKLVGTKSSTCAENFQTKSMEWDNKSPRCEQIKCEEALLAPSNGYVFCSNGNSIGSLCSFRCDNEFILDGHSESTCTLNEENQVADWDREVPECKRHHCESMLKEPSNGYMTCSDKNYLGSVCDFACETGYDMLGHQQAICVINPETEDPEWDNSPPNCSRKTCEGRFQNLPNGEIKCSDMEFLGSVCEFSCDNEYELVGPERATCMEDYESHLPKWSGVLPKCVRKRCASYPESPANGNKVCSDEKFVNSVCEFTCDDEFMLVGPAATECLASTLLWSHRAPICDRKRCENGIAPANGHVSCHQGNIVGSVCTFKCDKGFRLVGEKEAICVETEKDSLAWSQQTPTCIRKWCEELLEAPANGYTECTDDNQLGSICQFFCDETYLRVGSQYSTCTEDYKTGVIAWDNTPAKCIRKECNFGLPAPLNGVVQCSDRKFVGSTCRFSCAPGFSVAGPERSMCMENPETMQLEWDNKPPKCTRVKCGSSPAAPANGYVVCTDSNNIGSSCSFNCSKKFHLEGRRESTCTFNDGDQTANWNHEAPLCKRQSCEPVQTAPVNGYASCSDSNFLGSACEFACGSGLERLGSQVYSCIIDPETGLPAWDNAPPECIRMSCPSAIQAPSNGDVRCSDMEYLGSVCVFSCDDEYDLVGPGRSTCVEEYESKTPQWNNETPKCVRKQCAYMPTTPPNGDMSCSDKMNYGSVCTFSCSSKYELVGPSQVNCGFTEYASGQPVWNTDAPMCKRKECEPAEKPVNGVVVCDYNNFIGSECEYFCDEFHHRVGSSHTVCQEDSTGQMLWSNEKPVCERITCPVLDDIKFGKTECTDEEFVNSECEFSCSAEGYRLLPRTKYSVTCQNDSTWSGEPPCCARSCPPYAAMDLIVVLDSSSSIGANNWKIMVKFVRNIIELFVIKEDAMNFGVVRYNKKVDNETQINLNDCPNNVTMLKELVSNMPYDGSGTRTGRALTYVHENMLPQQYGNRDNAPDVVLVITDGKSQDDVKKPAYALREAGVLTYALGITPTNGKLDEAQLQDIAGSDSRLFMAKYGFENLTPEFAEEISENICGDPPTCG